MVCHIDKETGGLVVLIPVCVRCKRALKRDTYVGISPNPSETMMSAPMTVKEVTFTCPKGHATFKVGNIDLAEMVKYPQDKIVFESSASLDPSQFPVIKQ